VVAVLVWYVGSIEEKWSQNLKPVRPAFGVEEPAAVETLPDTAHVHADGSIHVDGHGHVDVTDDVTAKRNDPEPDPV